MYKLRSLVSRRRIDDPRAQKQGAGVIPMYMDRAESVFPGDRMPKHLPHVAYSYQGDPMRLLTLMEGPTAVHKQYAREHSHRVSLNQFVNLAYDARIPAGNSPGVSFYAWQQALRAKSAEGRQFWRTVHRRAY